MDSEKHTLDHHVLATTREGRVVPIWDIHHNRDKFTRDEAVDTAARYNAKVPEYSYEAKPVDEEEWNAAESVRQEAARLAVAAFEAEEAAKAETATEAEASVGLTSESNELDRAPPLVVPDLDEPKVEAASEAPVDTTDDADKVPWQPPASKRSGKKK